VYCAGAKGIYKVKLKNGVVKDKKCIYKSYRPFGAYSYIWSMRKIGKRIFFELGTEGTFAYLYRVSTSGTNKKQIATLDESNYGYAVKNGIVYIGKKSTAVKRNYDGKKLGTAKIKVRNNYKKRNKSGYKMKIKEKGKYAKDYLVTPKGSYYLGKIKLD
jgi:hypothetical protein